METRSYMAKLNGEVEASCRLVQNLVPRADRTTCMHCPHKWFSRCHIVKASDQWYRPCSCTRDFTLTPKFELLRCIRNKIPLSLPTTMHLSVVLLGFIGLLIRNSDGFSPIVASSRKLTQVAVSITPEALQRSEIEKDEHSYALSIDEAGALIKLGKAGEEKIINSFGLWCAGVSIVTGPIWMMAMSIINFINKQNEDLDPHKAIYDATGKIWSKIWLSLTNCYPTVSGNVQLLKEHSGPCLYVANHASWMDIPVLCTVLDPVFKFIAKGELKKVPCIGQQLSGGNHILIDRDDRKSQLRTFKEGIAWLNKGVPIMAFPEGMRSRDGRLMDFKKGLFSLAVKTKIPIIPITISHTHAVMPGFALFPVQSGAGKIHVHINEPISAEGRNEAELEEMVRNVFLNTLPASQLPLDAFNEFNASEKVTRKELQSV